MILIDDAVHISYLTSMTKYATCLMLALTLLPLGAQEKAGPAKKPKAPPIGVLRPPEQKDLSGEVLDLKLSEAAMQATLKNLYQIYQCCFAYAQSNDQVLPQGKTSNDAFRQFFIKGLVDDERLFYISELGEREGLPDGNRGNEKTGFAKALEPGECNISYVSGLTTDRDYVEQPLIFAKVSGEDGNIYILVVHTDGTSKTYKTKNGLALEKRDGEDVNIFSEEAGFEGGIVRPAKKVK